MKFAANLSMLFQESGVGMIKRYEAAAKAGFKYVEFTFAYDENLDELKKVKENLGLKQVLINSPIGKNPEEDKGFACLPNKSREFKESIETAIRFAKALNCERVHFMAGKKSPNFSESEMNASYLERLKYAAAEFQKANIICLIEPINNFSVPNYFLNSFDQAMQYLNIPNVKLQLDVFHLQILCGNLTYHIKKLMPYIGHVQIAQVPDRHEPDSPGEINYTYLFQILKDLNYQGYIGCEYFPAKNTLDGLKWVKNYPQEMN